MTAAQFQSQQEFFLEQVKTLKKIFEDSSLSKWIIMAGIGAVAAVFIELGHIVWLAIRYIWKF